jgi:acyl carrier protein
MSNNIESKVIALVAEQLHMNPQEITPDATLQSLGADSLDRVELVMKFEEEFHIEIRDEDAEKLVTIADLVNYIKNLSNRSN